MSPSLESIPEPFSFPRLPAGAMVKENILQPLPAPWAAQTFLCTAEIRHSHPCRPSAGPGARPLHVELHQEPSPSPGATTPCPPATTESHRGRDKGGKGGKGDKLLAPTAEQVSPRERQSRARAGAAVSTSLQERGRSLDNP